MSDVHVETVPVSPVLLALQERAEAALQAERERAVEHLDGERRTVALALLKAIDDETVRHLTRRAIYR